MKKIIKGKVYDTDTAKELGSDSNGGTWQDFGHWVETLYRKKTGEYFLFGQGGPMTQYAEYLGQGYGRTNGSKIMPMTYQDATQWAEEHLSADEYEEIFGAVVEDDTKRVVTYNLTVTAVEKLRRMAEMGGKSASEILEVLILKA